MSVPSGPSRSSGQEPGYWDRPENQPGHPEFWSPGLAGSRVPRGVLTRTARGSLISFVLHAAAGVIYVVTLFLDLPPDWSNGRTYFRITAPALFALLALRYLRSWRLLRRRADQTPANADSA